jgi:hypothetical protein
MANDKKSSDFQQGDSVEFRCRGLVSKVTPMSVCVRLDDLDGIPDIPIPAHKLTNLSKTRQMLEEAMKRDIDDELVKAVGRVLGDLFWHEGRIAEPHPSTEEVALAAIDAMYSFQRKKYPGHE